MVWWTMLMDIFLVLQSWNTIAYIVYATSHYIIDVRVYFVIAWLLPFFGKSWECKECEWNTMGCPKMTDGWIINGNSWIQLIVIRFSFYSLSLLYAIKKGGLWKNVPLNCYASSNECKSNKTHNSTWKKIRAILLSRSSSFCVSREKGRLMYLHPQNSAASKIHQELCFLWLCILFSFQLLFYFNEGSMALICSKTRNYFIILYFGLLIAMLTEFTTFTTKHTVKQSLQHVEF